MSTGESEFYVSYFQQPGRAEAEIGPDVRGWLGGFYAALSADTMPGVDHPDVHFVQLGGRLRERFPADTLPAWLTPEDLDVYASEFERTGMTGALNRYRNMDRDWEDLAAFGGRPPDPADTVHRWGPRRLHRLDERRHLSLRDDYAEDGRIAHP
jgi:hypothetical protein